MDPRRRLRHLSSRSVHVGRTGSAFATGARPIASVVLAAVVLLPLAGCRDQVLVGCWEGSGWAGDGRYFRLEYESTPVGGGADGAYELVGEWSYPPDGGEVLSGDFTGIGLGASGLGGGAMTISGELADADGIPIGGFEFAGDWSPTQCLPGLGCIPPIIKGDFNVDGEFTIVDRYINFNPRSCPGADS